ncbi:MAG: carboxypeptidase-like regulatory domain-containing protein, partial [Deltaproteobacteria bacterium]|nr:carboxypeptidase-like regulatory domain-containing protein [Deltaproteobacteria bacterium]
MKRKWCALLVCAMIVSLGLAGCSSDDTSVSSSGDTIKASTEAIFTGQVLNVLDKPMAGVAVTLYAKNKYTTKTDDYGNYMITVSLGDVVATPGGGSGTKDDVNIGDGDIVKRTFPIEIQEKGYAVFRQLVNFEGVLGYTDGTGAVVLLSQVGQCIPTVWLDPIVDNFKFTVYAQGVPAPYATVSLYPDSMDNYQVSSEKCGDDDGGCWYYGWYETGIIQLHSDANGVVEIKAEDGIPAQDYDVFAAPYDVNGDGIFEYDASNETQPWGGFDLCIGDGLLDLIYNQESDSYAVTQTAFAPSVILNDGQGCIDVVFCNMEDLKMIPQAQSANFQITVMLGRPIMVNADGVTIPG